MSAHASSDEVTRATSAPHDQSGTRNTSPQATQARDDSTSDRPSQAPPRLVRHVQHTCLPTQFVSLRESASSPSPSSTATSASPGAAATAEHAGESGQSRLARSLSRLADSVSTQLFRSSPTTHTVVAREGADVLVSSPLAAPRDDVAPEVVRQYVHELLSGAGCAGDVVVSQLENIYVRTYYTGDVMLDDASVDSDVTSPGLTPHDADGRLVSVVFGIIRAGCACPLVPRREVPTAPTADAPGLSKTPLHRHRPSDGIPLRFPLLTAELLSSATDGACRVSDLLKPPEAYGGTTHVNQPDDASEALERVVVLHLCTYKGGLCEGRRHGLGTLTVYGAFTLTCIWDNDVPVVAPLPSRSLSPQLSSQQQQQQQQRARSTACTVLTEHLVTVVADRSQVGLLSSPALILTEVAKDKKADKSPAAPTAVLTEDASPRLAPLRVRTRCGTRYMGSLTSLPNAWTGVDVVEEPRDSDFLPAQERFRGLQWLLLIRLVPHGFGELRKGRRCAEAGPVNEESGSDDEEDGDDDNDDDPVESKATKSQSTVAAAAAAGAVGSRASKVRTPGTHTKSALRSPHSRRRLHRRYLASSAAPCTSTNSTSASGVSVEVQWYCGGWDCGKRDGFGLLVGTAAPLPPAGTQRSQSVHPFQHRCQRLSGEPCTYVGSFVQHRRCGPATLEMDRTGLILCGTWGKDGLLQPRVPHNLLFHGTTPYSLQGLLLQPGPDGQGGVEHQVLAAAGALHGRDDDVSAPLLFDQATLVQSAGAVNGTWEPLFVGLDNALGELCSAATASDEQPKTVDSPMTEMRAILARVVVLPEWCAVLAGFQRCFAALYAPCPGCEQKKGEKETVGKTRTEAAAGAAQRGADEIDTLHFLMAATTEQNVEEVSTKTSKTAFSWCHAALTAHPRDSPSPSTAGCPRCIHDKAPLGVSSPSLPDPHPVRSHSRGFVRYREKTPLALLQHAISLLRAMAMSLRLRALPLLGDRPWVADLLAASATAYEDHAATSALARHGSSAGSSMSARAAAGVELAQALATFCWTEAYKTVAPVLHRLCYACVATDVRSAVDRLLHPPAGSTTTVATHPSSASSPSVSSVEDAQQQPLLSLLREASAPSNWLTLYTPANVLRWRGQAAMLFGSDQYGVPSLHTLYLAIERCLALPRSAFLASNHDDQDEDQDHRVEELSLIEQASALFAAPTVAASDVFFDDTIYGPRLVWGGAPESAATMSDCAVSSAADLCVSLAHHAVSQFPDSVQRQQQWLVYVLVASAKMLLGTSGQPSHCVLALERAGFNPFAPLLQLHAVLLSRSTALPLPELSVLLLSDLVQQQRQAREQDDDDIAQPHGDQEREKGKGGDDDANQDTAQRVKSQSASRKRRSSQSARMCYESYEPRAVLHAVLVRLVCAVDSLMGLYPAAMTPQRPSHTVPCGVPGASASASAPAPTSVLSCTSRLSSLREISARARFILSPVPAYLAGLRSRACPSDVLTVNRAVGADTIVLNASAVMAALSPTHMARQSRAVVDLLQQPVEAMELALSTAGWVGVMPCASAGAAADAGVQGGQRRSQHPGRTAYADTAVVDDAKTRSTQAVGELAGLWGSTSEETDGEAGGAWLPAVFLTPLRASLHETTTVAVATTAQELALAARVQPTPFMKWLVTCVAQALSAPNPRASPPVRSNVHSFRRFVSSHKASGARLSGRPPHDRVREAGLTEADVWYVVLLLMGMESLGWSLTLTITLHTMTSDEDDDEDEEDQGARRVRAASAPVPPQHVGVRDDGAATPVTSAQQANRSDAVSIPTAAHRPVRRQTDIFASSSSSSSSSASSSPGVNSPLPADARAPSHRTRRSLASAGGGLFDGPEFRLSVSRTMGNTMTDGASVAEHTGIVWQVVEQACGIVSRQC